MGPEPVKKKKVLADPDFGLLEKQAHLVDAELADRHGLSRTYVAVLRKEHGVAALGSAEASVSDADLDAAGLRGPDDDSRVAAMMGIPRLTATRRRLKMHSKEGPDQLWRLVHAVLPRPLAIQFAERFHERGGEVWTAVRAAVHQTLQSFVFPEGVAAAKSALGGYENHPMESAVAANARPTLEEASPMLASAVRAWSPPLADHVVAVASVPADGFPIDTCPVSENVWLWDGTGWFRGMKLKNPDHGFFYEDACNGPVTAWKPVRDTDTENAISDALTEAAADDGPELVQEDDE